MHRILIITAMLPVSAIERKKAENDILLVIEDEIKARYADIVFRYVFIFPYATKILSKISSKWKSYYKLRKGSTFFLKNRELILFPVFLLRRRVFLRDILVRVSLFLFRKRFQRLICDFKPTVLHAQDADIAASIARLLGKKYNIPYLVTLRGINFHGDSIIRNNLVCASKLMAISPTQQRDLKKLVDRETILIPHGINSIFFQERERRERANDVLRLLVVGRLLRLKNIALVICIIEKYKNVTFDIIGDGPEMENLHRFVQQYGLKERVHFKGRLAQEDIVRILPEYDLFVMPSFPESLGRVYFEAMASGLPIIASKDTGVDGIITDGVEGFLVDHRSREEIDCVLKKIIESPSILLQMGENAQKLARKYGWAEIAKKYYDVYVENE